MDHPAKRQKTSRLVGRSRSAAAGQYHSDHDKIRRDLKAEANGNGQLKMPSFFQKLRGLDRRQNLQGEDRAIKNRIRKRNSQFHEAIGVGEPDGVKASVSISVSVPSLPSLPSAPSLTTPTNPAQLLTTPSIGIVPAITPSVSLPTLPEYIQVLPALSLDPAATDLAAATALAAATDLAAATGVAAAFDPAAAAIAPTQAVPALTMLVAVTSKAVDSLHIPSNIPDSIHSANTQMPSISIPGVAPTYSAAYLSPATSPTASSLQQSLSSPPPTPLSSSFASSSTSTIMSSSSISSTASMSSMQTSTTLTAESAVSSSPSGSKQGTSSYPSTFSTATSSSSSTSGTLTAPSETGSGAAGGSPPASSSSAAAGGSSSGTGPPTPVVVGGVVGGIAGLAIILVLLLFLLRWKRAKQRRNGDSIGDGVREPITGGSGDGTTTTQRSSQSPFVAALGATGMVRGIRPVSQQTASTNEERGFYKVSGRKLDRDAVGDGYDYRNEAANKEIGGSRPTSNPFKDENAVDNHPASPTNTLFPGAGGFAGRGSAASAAAFGFPSEPQGSPVMRSSPARTPVASTSNLAIFPPRTQIPPGPRTPPVARTPPITRRPTPSTGMDAVGRSHASYDGSRSSRFTEDLI